ncbi:MAG: hypothetical protein IH787_02755 [Nitrospirae bacterium]|nr:hypothetical protein [Nitrospirota bacterium]
MLGLAYFPATVHTLPGWRLLFAREPEPDMDFDDTSEMDKTIVLQPSSKKPSMPPAKPPNRRPLLLVLLLFVVGSGAYLFSNPDFLIDLLGDSPVNTSPIPPAPKIVTRTPPPQAFSGQASQPSPTAPPTSASAPAANATPASPGIPIPLFMEGQQAFVRIRADIRRRGIGGGLFPAQFGRLNDDGIFPWFNPHTNH